MQKVAAKRSGREIPPAFPGDIVSQPCGMCGVPVAWCKANANKHGTRPIAVEMAPPGGFGNVAIERELLGGAPNGAAFAYATNLRTRFRWHGPHCAGSFSGQAPARKVRP